jgi:predicted patatin/cPLA2 family phospholipase
MSHRPYFAPPDSGAVPRRALILAGGGMRVAWQAGVLRALAEEGLTFAHADGTSGGTMNLAMLLSGLSPVEMGERWRTLDPHGFSSFLPLAEYLHGPQHRALGDARGVTEKVFPHLGIDVAKINAATGMEGTFNVCNYTDKTNEVIPHERVDLDFLVAGMSLPIFMPAVEKNGVWYTDSVWIKDANLLEAARRGADELWLLWCIGNTSEYKLGAFNQYVHMIELAANGSLFEELAHIGKINERRARGETVYGHTRPVRLHVIRPEYPLPLDPDYFLGRIDGPTLVDLGYADAKRYLAHRSPDGLPFTPDITKMKNPTLGFTFRETMSGHFALGETDPRAGEKAGRAAGTELAMHATIMIDDLDRFIADPNHLGGLIGNIDFAPFGNAIPATRGVFNLFSPAEDPAMKLMVYELAFEHDRKPYYLAGHKEVKDDPGLDLWKDTTTLFTTLHEGNDKTGPAIGAGVLSLGPIALAKMVGTMHATGTDSVPEQAKAMARFGKFFMGDLWDTYIAKLGKR